MLNKIEDWLRKHRFSAGIFATICVIALVGASTNTFIKKSVSFGGGAFTVDNDGFMTTAGITGGGAGVFDSITASSSLPAFILEDTDSTPPAGLYRFVISGDDVYLQENTGTDFSTTTNNARFHSGGDFTILGGITGGAGSFTTLDASGDIAGTGAFEIVNGSDTIETYNNGRGLLLTGQPSSNTFSQGTLMVNARSSGAADRTLFGLGVADVKKFRVNVEGDTEIVGDLGVGGNVTVSSGTTGILTIGLDLTDRGEINIFGNSANNGGSINLFTGSNHTGNVDRWQINSNFGDMRISALDVDGGSVDEDPAFEIDGTTRSVTITNGLNVGGDILPALDSVSDLGSASLQWAEAHVDDIFTDGLNLGLPSARTISSGVVTKNAVRMTLTAESGGIDDLLTISGGADGDIIIIDSTVSGDSITLKDGTGNIQLRGGDFIMSGAEAMMLMFSAQNSEWLEI